MITRICTPYYSEFSSVAESLKTLGDDPRFEAVQSQGSVVAKMRNAFVQKDKESKAKNQPTVERNFLFVDSDISFTKEHVDRVLELSKQFFIVCLPYECHDYPDLYQCGQFLAPGVIKNKFSTMTKAPCFVDWCGAGFLYIRREVFAMMEYPYFRQYVLEIGNLASQVDDDIGFCAQVYKKIPILCDFSMPVTHNHEKRNGGK
jgi:hypothetical protein